MPSAKRKVILDDADPRIQYAGDWISNANGTFDNIGNFGGTFQSTLHGLQGSSGSFELIFEGSRAKVFGTLQNFRNDSSDPTWDCFVDGERIQKPSVVTESGNNLQLCVYRNGTAGIHNLSLIATSSDRQFWVDSIEFTPPSINDAQFILIGDDDPTVIYDDSWTTIPSFIHRTDTPGATVSINFNGTSLFWYGGIPSDMPREPATGSYSIDGAAPTPFTISRPLTSNNNQSEPFLNQLFFATPAVPFGLHNISVSYTTAGTPLSLDYIIVRNSEAPEPSALWLPSRPTADNNTAILQPTSSQASGRGSGPPNFPPDSLTRLSAGEIVACLFGASALIGLLVIAFIFGRHRYRQWRRPVIAPLPGFAPTRKPQAPLDIDTGRRRWSTFGDDRPPPPKAMSEKVLTGGTNVDITVPRRWRTLQEGPPPRPPPPPQSAALSESFFDSMRVGLPRIISDPPTYSSRASSLVLPRTPM